MKYIANPVEVDAAKIVGYGQVQDDGSLHLALDDEARDAAIRREAQAEAFEQAADAITMNGAFPTVFSEAILALSPDPNWRERIVAQARLHELKDVGNAFIESGRCRDLKMFAHWFDIRVKEVQAELARLADADKPAEGK